jgi:hypothetical protein
MGEPLTDARKGALRGLATGEFARAVFPVPSDIVALLDEIESLKAQTSRLQGLWDDAVNVYPDLEGWAQRD